MQNIYAVSAAFAGLRSTRTHANGVGMSNAETSNHDLLPIYEAQLRTEGSVTLSEENAAAFIKSRELKAETHPQHPGLIRLSRQDRLTLS